MNRFPLALTHPAHGRMTLDTSRLLLAFRQSLPDTEALRKKLAGLSLALEGPRDKAAQRPQQAVNHTDRRFWVRSLDGQLDDERLARIEQALGAALAWSGPVYRLPRHDADERSALVCPLPDVLLAKRRADDGQRSIDSMQRAVAGTSLSEDADKSRHLGAWHYLRIADPKATNVYRLRERLIEERRAGAQDLRFESMPLLRPAALVPDDPLYAQQWNMAQIGAPAAWDISTGSSSTVVCVLDEGCDLAHPDLVFSEPGINLGTMSGDGSPTGPHGTACAGIVAALFGNTAGVAGLAGNCQVMPVAFSAWTDVEVANGIRYAADHGAGVISMSFGWNGWDPAIVDPEIQHAADLDVVMCVATHNQDSLGITYPATNALVLACGASDQADNRKTTTSPDGETWWGSNFGPQMSVVAPGVLIPTTDQVGAAGYDAGGDYVANFNGTSSATPLVAGLAALLRSVYPTMDRTQVRNAIERGAEKTGALAYADVAGHANGSWNQEMGYGRINAFRALDLADLVLRDEPADAGNEPGTTGNFWDFSDIVVRISDDGVFVPADPAQSRHLELGQTNYLYVRVVNKGPRDARNVVVDARLTPFVGTQFVYPHDWTATDATHLGPTPMSASFATVAAGAEVIAKFSISAAQVQVLWNDGWHPCCVASVTADNDYAFASAAFGTSPIVTQRNNLAQRNLSLINVLADARGASAALPFLAGHALNAERTMQIVVDRSRLPKGAVVRLALDEGNLHFPNADLTPSGAGQTQPGAGCDAMVFLERTKLKTRLGCCEGVLTLEKGSAFECAPKTRPGAVEVQGGEVVLVGDRRYAELRDAQAVISIEKAPGQVVPLSVQVRMPPGLAAGTQSLLSVAQRDAGGRVVGGASAVFVSA